MIIRELLGSSIWKLTFPERKLVPLLDVLVPVEREEEVEVLEEEF